MTPRQTSPLQSRSRSHSILSPRYSRALVLEQTPLAPEPSSYTYAYTSVPCSCFAVPWTCTSVPWTCSLVPCNLLAVPCYFLAESRANSAPDTAPSSIETATNLGHPAYRFYPSHEILFIALLLSSHIYWILVLCTITNTTLG